METHETITETHEIISDIENYLNSRVLFKSDASPSRGLHVVQLSKTLTFDIVNDIPKEADRFYKLKSIEQAYDILIGLYGHPFGSEEEAKTAVDKFVSEHKVDLTKDIFLIPSVVPA